MKFGLPISFMVHGLMGVAGLIAFGGKVKAAPEARYIPVEIFTISDVSNVSAARRIKTPEPPPPAVVEPEIQQIISAPELAPSANLAPIIAEPKEAETEPVPPKIEAEPAAQAVIDVEPEKAAKAEPVKPAPPKPLSLDDLQKLTDVTKSKAPAISEQKLLTSEQNRIQHAELDRAAIGAGDGLSTSYEDAIMRKVYQGWQIPSGAPNMENLIVTINVRLAPDGRVEDAALSNESLARMRSDKFYAAAAESALRAVREAQRFAFLPRAQFALWQNLTLNFFPKDAPSPVPT